MNSCSMLPFLDIIILTIGLVVAFFKFKNYILVNRIYPNFLIDRTVLVSFSTLDDFMLASSTLFFFLNIPFSIEKAIAYYFHVRMNYCLYCCYSFRNAPKFMFLLRAGIWLLDEYLNFSWSELNSWLRKLESYPFWDWGVDSRYTTFSFFLT